MCQSRSYFYQYVATFAGAFSVMTSGINLSWTSPYLPRIMANTTVILVPTSSDGLLCAVAPLVGSSIGAMGGIYLADRQGRKISVLLMVPVVMVSWIIIAYSTSIWHLAAARFIMGATEGVSYTSLPMYIGEIAHPSIRGFLASTMAIFNTAGTVFINILGSYLSIYMSSLICIFIPVIHFVVFIFMPESPYYYIKKNNLEAARKSLQILRGTTDVNDEMDSLVKSINRQEQSDDCKVSDLFRIPSIRQACYIYLILNFTSKFSGRSPCLFYLTTIFNESGSNVDTTLSVILYSCVELVTVIISTYFIVDKFGRRPLMITSSIGCAISVFSLGFYFYLKDFHTGIIQHLNWLPLVALVSYNILFSIGLSFGHGLVLSELFPTNIKAKALGIADAYSVLMSVVVSKLFQLAMDHLTMCGPFFFFPLCCCIGLYFIVKYVPETKGKSLEEIQQLLLENCNAPETKNIKLGEAESFLGEERLQR